MQWGDSHKESSELRGGVSIVPKQALFAATCVVLHHSETTCEACSPKAYLLETVVFAFELYTHTNSHKTRSSHPTRNGQYPVLRQPHGGCPCADWNFHGPSCQAHLQSELHGFILQEAGVRRDLDKACAYLCLFSAGPIQTEEVGTN